MKGRFRMQMKVVVIKSPKILVPLLRRIFKLSDN